MQILLTGSTSQQCNPEMNRNVANFAGLLRKAFHLSGHEVFWREPSISWRAEEILNYYDHVVIGLAPVTSLSANRVYGALSLLDELMTTNPNKVSILLEAPEPGRIAAGNRAIMAHPENLTKMFYSYRKEYELATRDHRRLERIVARLHTNQWPTTIVPMLPWETPVKVAARLPYPSRRVVALNLDQLLLDDLGAWELPRQNIWVTDGATRHSVTLPQRAISRKGNAAHDTAVLRQMASSIGVLLETGKEGTWWSTRYVQSLFTGTPVFSDWRETGQLGSAWSVLPTNIETMTQEARDELAREQLDAYRSGCPDTDQIIRQVAGLLRARARTSILA